MLSLNILIMHSYYLYVRYFPFDFADFAIL